MCHCRYTNLNPINLIARPPERTSSRHEINRVGTECVLCRYRKTRAESAPVYRAMGKALCAVPAFIAMRLSTCCRFVRNAPPSQQSAPRHVCRIRCIRTDIIAPPEKAVSTPLWITLLLRFSCKKQLTTFHSRAHATPARTTLKKLRSSVPYSARERHGLSDAERIAGPAAPSFLLDTSLYNQHIQIALDGFFADLTNRPADIPHGEHVSRAQKRQNLGLPLSCKFLR